MNLHLDRLRATRLYESEASIPVLAARHGLDPAGFVDFSLNVNPFGPPAKAVEAARAALAEANLYPDLHYGRLRRALARRHDIPEDRLLFGSGLDDVIKLALHAWVGEGERVLVHEPTFPRYRLEAEARGAEMVGVRADPPWTIDLDAIGRALAAAPVALAFLCTPNNPTGAILEVEAIADLARGFARTLFLVDEALIDPRTPGAIRLPLQHANVATLRTFSKAFGLAGCRIGYAVAAPDLVEALELARPPFNLSLPGEAAALGGLQDDDYVARTQDAFARARQAFEAQLAGLPGCRLVGGYANMLLLALESVGSAELCERLARRGVVVADGRSFAGLETHDTVRISIRDGAANRRLLAALREAL